MNYYSNRNRGLTRWHVAILTFIATCLLLGQNPVEVATNALGSIATTTTAE